MHLTTPSLKIQVTGEYTVKTVKSTREILKDAVSSFQTKPSAQPALPYSAPSPRKSPPKAGGWCPCRDQSCSQEAPGTICQHWCCPGRAEAGGCPSLSVTGCRGAPLPAPKSTRGRVSSCWKDELKQPTWDSSGGVQLPPQVTCSGRADHHRGTRLSPPGLPLLSRGQRDAPPAHPGAKGQGLSQLQQIPAERHCENTSALLTSEPHQPSSPPQGQHTELAHSHPAPHRGTQPPS